MMRCYWKEGQYICEIEEGTENKDFSTVEIDNIDSTTIDSTETNGSAIRSLVVC